MYTLNQREKAKKNINKKKRQSMYIVESNNKYELMLKRLLDQKKIQRNGPTFCRPTSTTSSHRARLSMKRASAPVSPAVATTPLGTPSAR